MVEYFLDLVPDEFRNKVYAFLLEDLPDYLKE